MAKYLVTQSPLHPFNRCGEFIVSLDQVLDNAHAMKGCAVICAAQHVSHLQVGHMSTVAAHHIPGDLPSPTGFFDLLGLVSDCLSMLNSFITAVTTAEPLLRLRRSICGGEYHLGNMFMLHHGRLLPCALQWHWLPEFLAPQCALDARSWLPAHLQGVTGYLPCL